MLSEESPITGERLLTFNANSVKNGTYETGFMSGKGDPPSVQQYTQPRGYGAAGPYPVDARYFTEQGSTGGR
jgi:hypothetical protein